MHQEGPFMMSWETMLLGYSVYTARKKKKPLPCSNGKLATLGWGTVSLRGYPATSADQRLSARLPWRFSWSPSTPTPSDTLEPTSSIPPNRSHSCPPLCLLSWMTGGRNSISADLHQGSPPLWNGRAAHPLPAGHSAGPPGATYVWIQMRKGVRALGYNGLRDTREGKEGEGMGEGRGCNGLSGGRSNWRSWHWVSRAQTGNRRLAPTIVAPQGLSTIAMQVTAVNNDLRVLTV